MSDARQRLAAAFRKDLASVFEEHDVSDLRRLMVAAPAEFCRLAARVGVSIGPNPTNEDLGRVADRLVVGLRRGTPDEGKPLLKRMH